jgi:hypothetical protein
MDQISARRDHTVQLGIPTFTAAARTITSSTTLPSHPNHC